MKTYLINLDRSEDRLRAFADQAESRGIEFERISAVDGRSLSDQQRAAIVARTFEFQPINAGEIGVFLSHKQAWKKLVASGQTAAAVFEDDVILATSIRSTLDAIEHLEIDFDLIKLETTMRRVVRNREGTDLGCGTQLRTLHSWHGGAAGYVISADCARRLLEQKEQIADPVDEVLFNPISKISSQLNILQLTPAACIQNDILAKRDATATFGTTIDRHKTRGRIFRHGLLIDTRRLLNKQRESFRRRWMSRKKGNIQTVIPFQFECESASSRHAA